jgi:hypothetical protein
LKAETLTVRNASASCSRSAHLPRRFVEDNLFAHAEGDKKKRAHDDHAECEKQKHARQFPEEIFESRDGLGQNRVDGAILEILWDQARGGHDRQE